MEASLSKLRESFTADGRLAFGQIFGGQAPGSRRVNLEICSGSGEWVVEQAKADTKSDWVALELRHDRVSFEPSAILPAFVCARAALRSPRLECFHS